MKRPRKLLANIGASIALLTGLPEQARAQETTNTTHYEIRYEQESSPAITPNIDLTVGIDDVFRVHYPFHDAKDDLEFEHGSLGDYIERVKENPLPETIKTVRDALHLIDTTCSFAQKCEKGAWAIDEPIKITTGISAAAQLHNHHFKKLYGLDIGAQLDGRGKLHLTGDNLNNFTQPAFPFFGINSTTTFDAGINFAATTENHYRLEALVIYPYEGITLGGGYTAQYQQQSVIDQTFNIGGDIRFTSRARGTLLTTDVELLEDSTTRSATTYLFRPVFTVGIERDSRFRGYSLPIDASIEIGIPFTNTRHKTKRILERDEVAGQDSVSGVLTDAESFFEPKAVETINDRTRREEFGTGFDYHVHAGLPLPVTRDYGIRPYITFLNDDTKNTIEVGGTGYIETPLFSLAGAVTYEGALERTLFINNHPTITLLLPLFSPGRRGRVSAEHLDKRLEARNQFILPGFQTQLLKEQYRRLPGGYIGGTFSPDNGFSVFFGGNTRYVGGELEATFNEGVYIFDGAIDLDGMSLGPSYSYERNPNESGVALQRFILGLTLRD